MSVFVAGCSSGLDRWREDALNARYGVVLHSGKDGVEIRMSDATLFDTDDATIRLTSAPMLDRAAALLKRSSRPILVEGHTDNEGTRAYNDSLSAARAEAVADAHVARGVPAARIRTKGMAYLQPIASNDTPEGRALNRRVDILVKAETTETLVGPRKPTLSWLP
jgi:outer membrane protein OmpA-like peptidoglycan-associated protein